MLEMDLNQTPLVLKLPELYGPALESMNVEYNKLVQIYKSQTRDLDSSGPL